jgi:hypothetical protein
MTDPKRIQMSRQAPWRAANPDAVVVARPSRWGNPFAVGTQVDITISGPDGAIATIPITPDLAVACYRDLMQQRLTVFQVGDAEDESYVAKWRAELEALRGRDLVCWCALDAPCHADVLLELANAATAGSES